MNNQEIKSFDNILKESMQKSFIKAALLAKQTNTALVIWQNDHIVHLYDEQIDDYINQVIQK